MSGLSPAKAPLSPVQVYARLLAIDPAAALAYATSVASPASLVTPTGISLLAATTPIQAQAAIGIRRTFSPFAY